MGVARLVGLFVAIGVVGVVVASAACGPGVAAEPPYKFKDAKGRACSHARYESAATCDNAQPAPTNACFVGTHPCFIVYIGRGDLREVDAGPTTPQFMFNCDACCRDGSTAWTGISTDCSNVVCAVDADCAGFDGVCEMGRCRFPKK